MKQETDNHDRVCRVRREIGRERATYGEDIYEPSPNPGRAFRVGVHKKARVGVRLRVFVGL